MDRRAQFRTMCLVAISSGLAGAASRTLAIVTSSHIAAFDRTVEKVRSVSKTNGVKTVVFDAGENSRNLCNSLAANRPEIVLTIGTEAARLAGTCASGATRLLALSMGPPDRSRAPREELRLAPLDVPPVETMRAIRRWFSGKTRIGVIRNPLTAAYSGPEIEAEARDAGLRVHVLDCSRPEDLLEAFDRLARECDVVWCLPDSRLYTATTLKPLVLSSLARKVPLVGFSESFLRSGAAIAIFPDFERVAAHTADCLRTILSGKNRLPAGPGNYFCTRLNRRVFRLMNLPLRMGDADRSVVTVE